LPLLSALEFSQKYHGGGDLLNPERAWYYHLNKWRTKGLLRADIHYKYESRNCTGGRPMCYDELCVLSIVVKTRRDVSFCDLICKHHHDLILELSNSEKSATS